MESLALGWSRVPVSLAAASVPTSAQVRSLVVCVAAAVFDFSQRLIFFLSKTSYWSIQTFPLMQLRICSLRTLSSAMGIVSLSSRLPLTLWQ